MLGRDWPSAFVQRYHRLLLVRSVGGRLNGSRVDSRFGDVGVDIVFVVATYLFTSCFDLILCLHTSTRQKYSAVLVDMIASVLLC